MKDKKMTFKKLSHVSGVPISTIKTWSAGVEITHEHSAPNFELKSKKLSKVK